MVAVLTGGTVGGAMVLSEAGLGASILLTLLAAAPLVGLVALVPSYFLSLRIYREKDL